MSNAATNPLQSVAERIVARYLKKGMITADVQIVSGIGIHSQRGVDITLSTPGGARRTIKVKADPYFGTDASKIGDRTLAFYRADTGSFAFESLANAATREPGWMVDSEAEDLYYYYLALAQDEDEVGALLKEPDEVFFSEIRVERDDLIIFPMNEARVWFKEHADKYPPRPISAGATTAWYRLVPRSDVQRQVKGARIVGPVFPALAF